MRFVHTMLRVTNLERALEFYVKNLGLKEVRRKESESGRFTLAFLESPDSPGHEIELTYNWDEKEEQSYGRNFGHLAFRVKNIYETCEKLEKAGIEINRPPRDGRMAFIRSPDNHPIELLQEGSALEPQEPWSSMQNKGWW